MVCENPAFHFDFWNDPSNDSVVEVTCLMPNSISIPLTVSLSTSLHELKEVCQRDDSIIFLHLTFYNMIL